MPSRPSYLPDWTDQTGPWTSTVLSGMNAIDPTNTLSSWTHGATQFLLEYVVIRYSSIELECKRNHHA